MNLNELIAGDEITDGSTLAVVLEVLPFAKALIVFKEGHIARMDNYTKLKKTGRHYNLPGR